MNKHTTVTPAKKAGSKKKASAKKTAPPAKKKVAAKKATTKKTPQAASASEPAAQVAAQSRKLAGAYKSPEVASKFHPQQQEQLKRWIAEAAYYRAEQRDFLPGGEMEDWLAAERQIMEHLHH